MSATSLRPRDATQICALNNRDLTHLERVHVDASRTFGSSTLAFRGRQLKAGYPCGGKLTELGMVKSRIGDLFLAARFAS
jgi:hypothetical protein